VDLDLVGVAAPDERVAGGSIGEPHATHDGGEIHGRIDAQRGSRGRRRRCATAGAAGAEEDGAEDGRDAG
jgi:hypothetical protein